MPIFVTQPDNSPFKYRSIERLYYVKKTITSKKERILFAYIFILLLLLQIKWSVVEIITRPVIINDNLKKTVKGKGKKLL